MILSGGKVEEYRTLSPYWNHRLLMKEMPHGVRQDYDTVTFSNGYAKHRDQFEIELKRIDIRYGRTYWGAENGKKYYVLELGEIL